jgi:transcriptional regulator with PAS, ATPase and Fis domain
MNEMERVLALADRAARHRISVLILGETGVGKEVLARRLHRQSPRAAGPLVVVDCAALCASLAESTLFGHERGAFTGALRGAPGLLESANGGTVFFDELGDLPLPLQAKLLRAVDTRTVLPVGATRLRPLDVRFVAATNIDLDRRVAEGRFRADLLFRLDGIRLPLPPLRQRPGEILRLARLFLAEGSAQVQLPPPALSEAATAALEGHHWPGNVRELRHVIERALALHDGPRIGPEHLLLPAPPPIAAVARG